MNYELHLVWESECANIEINWPYLIATNSDPYRFHLELIRGVAPLLSLLLELSMG